MYERAFRVCRGFIETHGILKTGKPWLISLYIKVDSFSEEVKGYFIDSHNSSCKLKSKKTKKKQKQKKQNKTNKKKSLKAGLVTKQKPKGMGTFGPRACGEGSYSKLLCKCLSSPSSFIDGGPSSRDKVWVLLDPRRAAKASTANYCVNAYRLPPLHCWWTFLTFSDCLASLLYAHVWIEFAELSSWVPLCDMA